MAGDKQPGCRQPEVELGDLVYWYPDANASLPPHCGVVTRVSAQSLCVNLFDSATYTMLIRDGVKHVSDPTIRDAERREMGGWDHTPRQKRLRDLERQVRDLLAAREAKK